LQIDRQADRLEARNQLANEELLSQFADGRTGAPFVVVVEDVRSLWNVGSIFRTADGAGCSLLVLCGITGCPPRKEIAKTSLGAEDSVSWLYASSVTDVVASLKKHGFLVVGLEVTTGIQGVPDSVDLKDAIAGNKIRVPLCLVVGNEVTGLSVEALSDCDVICHLPMRGIKESLNVAVAFGIAAYDIAEQVGGR
jgi:tRNA G18 (ribose-2'-O)-methylase SpoU